MGYLAVAIGGFVGACARYGVAGAMGTFHGFPLSTVLINLSGSFVLAWFYTITLERYPIHPHLRLGFGTGFIGAFTTFSTLNTDVWALWQSGEHRDVLLYIVLTYIGGLVLAALGYALAMRQSRLRMTTTGTGV